MAPASATRPMRPSSASISRTRWPLPSPPIEGLHDMAPTVAKRWVINAVRAPSRAAAAAASQPAWPPPTTTTAYFTRASLTAAKIGTASDGVEVSRETSLADAEIGENHIKQILDINLACYAAETAP